MSRTKGWDVRVPVSILHNPDYLGLSTNAFTALILLQCMSARDEITDGLVTAKEYTASRGYPGLPIVAPKDREHAFRELEDAGLLQRVDDGVKVLWDHQTSRAKRDEERDSAAERKRRSRAAAAAEPVTRDGL